MLNDALSMNDQRLLIELLGNGGEPGSSPSSEIQFEKDQARSLVLLLSLFLVSLLGVVLAWMHYGKDVTEALLAAEPGQARALASCRSKQD
ncbi:hypothetical protein BWQ96_01989 [Gracilariopsis chorda]|uniref:Uncharacterized protein n=1 Tax=Gracilariopsis chorda TaxID=448386 RepID=A0A2V3J4K2_9FLOR|nr:hypothetical protein BWQ96_01989 [Gracilariopsis chorda]|eukprot:PXF48300.1 hypothetical protein BWQ96_01989 [Gracilariopsis chorda]